MFPLHDLEDLGIELDVESVEAVTVAGLVHELLGRLPKVGDAVSVEGWTYTVDVTSRRAIDRVTIRAATRQDEHGRTTPASAGPDDTTRSRVSRADAEHPADEDKDA
jgi:Mg2+/Co2+ transporter CorC